MALRAAPTNRSRRRSRMGSAVAASVLAAVVVVPATAGAGVPAPVGRSVVVPSAIDSPTSLSLGTDGTLWFANEHPSSLGRVTSDGVVQPTITRWENTQLHQPMAWRHVRGAPDGSAWAVQATEGGAGRLVNASPDGTFTFHGFARSVAVGSGGEVYATRRDYQAPGQPHLLRRHGVWEVPLPTSATPDLLAVEPDGDVWLAAPSTEGPWTVTRVSAAGEVGPSVPLPVGTSASNLVVHPDGDLWYSTGATIVRISPDGTVLAQADAPSPVRGPTGMVVGPDGDVWAATSVHPVTVVRVDPAGDLTTFTQPSGGGFWADSIAVGPDGNLWVAADAGDRLLRFDADGVALPPVDHLRVPSRPVTAADGRVWYVNGPGGIGRTAPDLTSSAVSLTGLDAHWLAPGADGNVWFLGTTAGDDAPVVGHVGPDDVVTTLPAELPDGPHHLTPGPDGALWFLGGDGTSVGRVGGDGEVATFAVAGIAGLSDLVAGPDANLWATSSTSPSVARIATDGTSTVFTSEELRPAAAIAVGPDDALWAGASDEGALVRIALDGSAQHHPYDGPPVGDLHAGDDGNLWVSALGELVDVVGEPNFEPSYLGRFDTSGNRTGWWPSTRLEAMTGGADGRLWAASTWGELHAVTVSCEPLPFSDVDVDHPFCGSIAWLEGAGITTGFPDGTFRPAQPVSRQELAAFLHRMAGSPTPTPGDPVFADVTPGHPFYAAIQWMGQQGFATGTPQPPARPRFDPGQRISRQAAAAFLHRYAGSPPVDGSLWFFADVNRSNPFYDSIQWLGTAEISTGSPNAIDRPLFDPPAAITRMAMAAFLDRYARSFGPGPG